MVSKKSSKNVTGTMALLNCPALHYNWGFHDARADIDSGRGRKSETWLDSHFDHAYATGYRAGLRPNASPIPSDSEAFNGWD
jgi:hypothetical protein